MKTLILLFVSGLISFSFASESLNESLFETIQRNDLDRMIGLIEQGADIKSLNSQGKTPFQVAVFQGHLELAEFLLEKGADVNTRDNQGNSPLYDAIITHQLETAEFLLKNGADVNIKDHQGNIILHDAISIKGEEIVTKELVQFLLKNGADVNVQDNQGRSALHFAALSGKVYVIEMLSHHPEINLKLVNTEGKTYLEVFKLVYPIKHDMFILKSGTKRVFGKIKNSFKIPKKLK